MHLHTVNDDNNNAATVSNPLNGLPVNQTPMNLHGSQLGEDACSMQAPVKDQ